jgi:hypothetical protein
MHYKLHPSIPHPKELLRAEETPMVRVVDTLLDWLARKVLSSRAMFVLALVLPLSCVDAPIWVKLLLALISGSWIQWWALHAIQRSSMADALAAAAKTETDHQSLVYLARKLDDIEAKIDRITTTM